MSYQYNPETDTVDLITSGNDIYDYFSSKGFFFSKEILSKYYLSLKTKPFVILSGISGTGKTKIAQLFADYICQDNNTEEKNCRIAFISVRPDWMDNKGLLGYYNIFTEKYQTTDMLDVLLRASANPNEPHFVILDEMNLAKVEHYFSDFLSILESRTKNDKEGRDISLHSSGDDIYSDKGKKIPEKTKVPANVFFAGTINIDESTYMFSPKVLDRANVIEFNDVDLNAYEDGRVQHDGIALINGNVLNRFLDKKSTHFCEKQDYDKLASEGRQYLKGLLKVLEEYNLHFGYRVVNELGKFVNLAMEEVGKDCLDDAMDIQIMQKILPKLHGTRAKLQEPLEKLLLFCQGDSGSSSSAAPLFPRSAQKIFRMIKQLEIQGYASFVE